MITFRNYLLTLVAAFLALACGIALGGGPLSELGRAATPTPAAPARTTSADRYPDLFAGATAQRLYASGLKDRDVSVVTLPGADPVTVAALGRQITLAGGRVSGTYAVGPQLVDAAHKSLVDTLGSQLMTQLGGQTISRDASTYPRLGQLLGVAVATTGTHATPTDQVATVRQSLAAARLLSAPKSAPAPSSLVLVVLGDEVDQPILSGLLEGLGGKAQGVVAVAKSGSPNAAGLEADGVTDTVTVVDGDDSAAGRAAAVLGLQAALTHPGGSYGASGADGAAPLG